MSEWTTITVQQSTLERFKQLKADVTGDNMPEQSADLFLQSLMDTWDIVDEGSYPDDVPSQDEVKADVSRILESLEKLDAEGTEGEDSCLTGSEVREIVRDEARKAIRDELR